jgi:hypothetical protein
MSAYSPSFRYYQFAENGVLSLSDAHENKASKELNISKLKIFIFMIFVMKTPALNAYQYENVEIRGVGVHS